MNDTQAKTGSNWTGRTPRTLQQAFGPYASISGEYGKQTSRNRRRWRRALAECAALALAVVVLGAMLAIGAAAGL